MLIFITYQELVLGRAVFEVQFVLQAGPLCSEEAYGFKLSCGVFFLIEPLILDPLYVRMVVVALEHA